MNNLQQYFIYFVIYIYIFIFFLKGYYPANETGILFIGFLIFMTVAYNFVGKALKEEFNIRIKNIYSDFEYSLTQNFNALNNLKDVYLNLSHKTNILETISLFFSNLNIETAYNFNLQKTNFLNYFIDRQLDLITKQQLVVYQKFLTNSYLLSIDDVLEEKQNLDDIYTTKI